MDRIDLIDALRHSFQSRELLTDRHVALRTQELVRSEVRQLEQQIAHQKEVLSNLRAERTTLQERVDILRATAESENLELQIRQGKVRPKGWFG